MAYIETIHRNANETSHVIMSIGINLVSGDQHWVPDITLAFRLGGQVIIT